ncbi:hypothetical protein V8E55_012231 [Tylopilus felleus]
MQVNPEKLNPRSTAVFNDRPVVKVPREYHTSAVWGHGINIVMSPFRSVLTAVEAGVWPYPFAAISDALTAFVTQIYLGSRQDGYGNKPTYSYSWCAIQTALFASIFALGDLIRFLALPDTNLYGMFAIPLGRIDTNASMVNKSKNVQCKVSIFAYSYGYLARESLSK